MIHGDIPLGAFHSVSSAGRHVTVLWTYRLALSQPCDQDVLQEVDEWYPHIRDVLSGASQAQEAYDSAIPEVYGHA